MVRWVPGVVFVRSPFRKTFFYRERFPPGIVSCDDVAGCGAGRAVFGADGGVVGALRDVVARPHCLCRRCPSAKADGNIEFVARGFSEIDSLGEIPSSTIFGLTLFFYGRSLVALLCRDDIDGEAVGNIELDGVFVRLIPRRFDLLG